MRKQNNKIKFNPNDQVEVRSIVKDSLEKIEGVCAKSNYEIVSFSKDLQIINYRGKTSGDGRPIPQLRVDYFLVGNGGGEERGGTYARVHARSPPLTMRRRLREGSLYPREPHNCSPFSARTSLINQSSPMAFRPLFRRAATEKQSPPSSLPVAARRTSATSNSNSFPPLLPSSLLSPPPFFGTRSVWPTLIN